MKHIIRVVLCLCLALSMVLSLAACGSKDVTEKTAKTETDAAETAEDRMVYKADFVPVKTQIDNGISPLAYTDDGIYAQSWQKIGEREIPKDAVIHYEGEYDIYGAVLYYVDLDGNARKLEEYTNIPIPEDTEDRLDYYGSSSLARS